MLDELIEKVKSTRYGQEHVLPASNQMMVLSHPDQKFVVKVPKGRNNLFSTSGGYRLAKERLGGLIVPFVPLRIAEFTLDKSAYISSDVILQKKADDYYEVLKSQDEDAQAASVRKTADIDKEMLQRGVCLQDTYHHNFGFVEDDMFVIDAGLAIGWEEIDTFVYSSPYIPDLPNTETYFLERGFCLHNRLWENTLLSERLGEVFRESVGIPLIEEYRYGVGYELIEDNFAISDRMFRDLFSEREDILEGYALSTNKPQIILNAASNIDAFGNELMNYVQRHEHIGEFIEVGRKEHELWYQKPTKLFPVTASREDFL